MDARHRRAEEVDVSSVAREIDAKRNEARWISPVNRLELEAWTTTLADGTWGDYEDIVTSQNVVVEP